MDNYDKGITAESEKLYQALLEAAQLLPKDTLFSDHVLLKKTCERFRGENETKVVRDIAQLIARILRQHIICIFRFSLAKLYAKLELILRIEIMLILSLLLSYEVYAHFSA
jgi:hypothetical protein